MKKRFVIIYILVFILFFCSTAFACTYANTWWETNPPCKRFNNSNIVALGTVKKVKIIKDAEENNQEFQILRFEVQEIFKGSPKKFINLKTSYGMCSKSFRVGEKFIVYSSSAANDSNTYQANEYSIKGEKGFDLDLEYCRKAKKGIAGATISNIFVRSYREEIDDRVDISGIAGVNFLIEGPKSTYNLKTNADGEFLLYELPAGRYKITADIYDWFGKKMSGDIEISENACEEIWGGTTEQSSVSGALLKPNGELASKVEIQLIALDTETGEPTENTLSEMTDENGQFEISNVPEGKYLLAHNYTDAQYDGEKFKTSFFPGVEDYKSGSVIEVKNRRNINLGYYKLIADTK